MATQRPFYKKEITAGAVPVDWGNIPLNTNIDEYHIYTTGAVTLTASWTLTPKITDTPTEGMFVRMRYHGNVTMGSYSITLFGRVLTAWEALHHNIVEARYNGTAWEVFLYRDYSTILASPVGTEIIASTTGGTVTLDPKVNEKFQIVKGTTTLASNLIITTGGSPTDEDEFIMFYEGLITLGAFTLTIFGKNITAKQALQNLYVHTKYCATDGLWHTAVLSLSANTLTSGVQIYYVGKHGVNTNDGLTNENAFLTFGYAITTINALSTGPSATNRYVIECFDAGIYTENLVIPAFVTVNAPSATINGYHHLDGSENALVCKDINYSGSGVAVKKTAGTTTSSALRAERIICTGSASGIGADLGVLHVDIDSITTVNGNAITNLGSSCTIRGNVDYLYGSGAGYGISATGSGMTLDMILGRVNYAGGYGFSLEKTIASIVCGYLEGTAAITIDASSFLYLTCPLIAGTRTFASGATVVINGTCFMQSTLSADGVMTIPAGYEIKSIVVEEDAGAVMTGGLKIGNTAGGTEVVNAEDIQASALVSCALGKTIFSLTSTTALYVRAVSAWNGARINVNIRLEQI
jgi:hypothetical protein